MTIDNQNPDDIDVTGILHDELNRVGDDGHPMWVDAHHAAIHRSLAFAIEALEAGLAAGVPGNAGATLTNYSTRMDNLDAQMRVLMGRPVPGPQGPKGDSGPKGDPGSGFKVTTATTPPPNPNTGDIWINDLTQRPMMWSGGAWNPLSGLPGASGTNGRDGRGIKTVTVAMVPNTASPQANYNPVTEVLSLAIPRGANGEPAQYRGVVPDRASLPTATPSNVAHIYGVQTESAWYWSNGIQWVLMGYWMKGDKGDRGLPGAPAHMQIGPTTVSAPGTNPAVIMRDLGNGDYRLDFTLPKPKDGDKGPAGETLAPQGAVGTVNDLPGSPPRLTILATTTPKLWLWIYDPQSPAASNGPAVDADPPVGPAGWVSLGAVTAPPGPKGDRGPAGHPVVFNSFADRGALNAHVAAGAPDVPDGFAGFFMVRDSATVFGYVKDRNPALIELGSLQTPSHIPPGGVAHQVLTKSSDADFDFQWGNPGTLPVGTAQGDIPVWDATNNLWATTAPYKLPDGTTVDVRLLWDGAKWAPSPRDVPKGQQIGETPVWDGTNWVPTTVRGVVVHRGTAAPLTADCRQNDFWLRKDITP